MSRLGAPPFHINTCGMKFFGCAICPRFDERVKRPCSPKCLATDFSTPIKPFSSRNIIPWCNFTHSPTHCSILIFLKVGISLHITLLLIQAFLLFHQDWSYSPSAHHFINICPFLFLTAGRKVNSNLRIRYQTRLPVILTFLPLNEKWSHSQKT